MAGVFNPQAWNMRGTPGMVPLSPLSRQWINQTAGGFDRVKSQMGGQQGPGGFGAISTPQNQFSGALVSPLIKNGIRPMPVKLEAPLMTTPNMQFSSTPMEGGGGGGKMPHGGGYGHGGGGGATYAPRPQHKIDGHAMPAPGASNFGSLDPMYAARATGLPMLPSGTENPTASGASVADAMHRGMGTDINGDSTQVAPTTFGFRGMGVKPMQGFAEGTQGQFATPVNQPFVVGENGPEVMSLPVPAKVVPNEQLLQTPDGSIKAIATPYGYGSATAVAAPQMKPMDAFRSLAASPDVKVSYPGMKPMPLVLDAQARPAVPLADPVSIARAQMVQPDARLQGLPAGVDPRAFKQFMKSPQGVAFAVGNAEQRRAAGERFGQQVALTQVAGQQRAEQQDKVLTAKQQQQERDQQALMAGYDLMLKDHLKSGHLTPEELTALDHAPDVKTRAAMMGVFAQMAQSRKAEREAAAKDAAMRQPWSVTEPLTQRTMFGVGHNAMGTVQPPAPVVDPKQFGLVPDSATVGGVRYAVPKPTTEKSGRAPTVRELRTPGGPGQPDQVSYLQWYPDTRSWGPMARATGAAGAGGAVKPSAFTQKFAQ